MKIHALVSNKTTQWWNKFRPHVRSVVLPLAVILLPFVLTAIVVDMIDVTGFVPGFTLGLSCPMLWLVIAVAFALLIPQKESRGIEEVIDAIHTIKCIAWSISSACIGAIVGLFVRRDGFWMETQTFFGLVVGAALIFVALVSLWLFIERITGNQGETKKEAIAPNAVQRIQSETRDALANVLQPEEADEPTPTDAADNGVKAEGNGHASPTAHEPDTDEEAKETPSDPVPASV